LGGGGGGGETCGQTVTYPTVLTTWPPR